MVYLSTLLLTKNAHADYERRSLTYNIAGGLPDSGVGPYAITFWFNINSVVKYITTAELTLYIDDINYPDEEDMVTFIEPDGTEHPLGLLETITPGKSTIHLSLNPGWINSGTNTVRVDIKPGWSAAVDDAALSIKYTIWTRDSRLVSKQVWVNEKGNFEFIFDSYYKNNNWVRIFDTDGNMVYEIDFDYGKNRFEVDLPDGIYTVRTFHLNPDEPIQEFNISKP